MKKKAPKVRERDDMHPEYDFSGGVRGKYVKRLAQQAIRDADEMRPEYDFSKGRRNPYASRYQEGSLTVVLAPDVAKRFPSARAVNKALRALGDDRRRSASNRRSKRRSA